MSIDIKLTAYEGPLDLLLLLIEKNKVDIYDIPIAEITDQYLEYVEEMKAQNLDTLSDFLVVAATLLDIKARMLLPKEEDENGEEIDPRSALVEQLIEYQEFKLMARELKEYYDETALTFLKDTTLPENLRALRPKPDMGELLQDVTLEKLQEVFEEVLKRKEEAVNEAGSSFGTIRKDPVRIADKLTHVMDFGRAKKHFSFRSLLEEQPTRSEVVVTFLACLELIHVGQISVSQEETDGEIRMIWNDDCDRVLSKEDIEQYD